MNGSNFFYHRGAPVSDPAFFFGRTEELARLFDLLLRGQSVSISGQRRMGKTSLLYQCSHPQISAGYGLDQVRTRWIYLDGGLFDGLDEDSVYRAINKSIHSSDSERDPYTDLVDHVRQLETDNLRVIVVMDEFEIFAENDRFLPRLFNRLKSIAAPQFPVQFVIASKEPLAKISFANPNVVSSPFFTIFAPFRLTLLLETEAVELLTELSGRGGRKFQVETIDFILEIAGPHPHFLQVAGYHAFNLHEHGRLTSESRAEIKERTLQELEGHLEYYWRNLSPEEQYTLSSLPLLAIEGYSPITARLSDLGFLFEKGYLGSIMREFVAGKSVAGLLRQGPFVMDEPRRLLTVDGIPVHLTSTEYLALRLMLHNPGRLVTPEEIEASLWPEEISPDPERARGIMKKLRAKLGDAGEWIYTQRGEGYKLTQPQSQ